jgi:hypothetical protein
VITTKRTESLATSRAIDPDGIASWVSAVLYAAARLGLADQLATEPKKRG